MVEDAFGHVSICNTVLSSSVHLTGKSSKGLGLQCPGADIAKYYQVLPSITENCLALQEECRA